MRRSLKHLPCQSLDALETASREALLETWRGLMGRPPPKSISRPLLSALLAFELQQRESPDTGLGKSFLKALAQAASHTPPRPKLRPGGRLVRDWQGRSYIVDVTDQGYLFDGKALETTCQRAILQHLREGISAHQTDATEIRRAQLAMERLEAAFAASHGALLRSLILDGLLTPQRLSLTLEVKALTEALGFTIPQSLATLTYPLQLRRSWKETKIILADPLPEPDPPLIKALYKAHLWIADLKAGASVAEVAAKHALTGSDLRKRIYLACLSPKIQRAILAGTFPETISLTSLATQKLPLSWAEQHALFLHDTPC